MIVEAWWKADSNSASRPGITFRMATSRIMVGLVE
jgi:hypothetical protein